MAHNVPVPRAELDEIVRGLERIVAKLTRIIDADRAGWADTGSGPGYGEGDVHDPRD